MGCGFSGESRPRIRVTSEGYPNMRFTIADAYGNDKLPRSESYTNYATKLHDYLEKRNARFVMYDGREPSFMDCVQLGNAVRCCDRGAGVDVESQARFQLPQLFELYSTPDNNIVTKYVTPLQLSSDYEKAGRYDDVVRLKQIGNNWPTDEYYVGNNTTCDGKIPLYLLIQTQIQVIENASIKTNPASKVIEIAVVSSVTIGAAYAGYQLYQKMS